MNLDWLLIIPLGLALSFLWRRHSKSKAACATCQACEKGSCPVKTQTAESKDGPQA